MNKQQAIEKIKALWPKDAVHCPMNKIQEVMEQWRTFYIDEWFSIGDIKKLWVKILFNQNNLLRAVIEEIEKLQEENYATPPADEEERIDESWYNAGLQKIKQLLEDSIWDKTW